jgi:hypothetical protein
LIGTTQVSRLQKEALDLCSKSNLSQSGFPGINHKRRTPHTPARH